MTISVVIPTFNRADLLRRALRSVAAQTHRPDEVIVTDNASSDQTDEVIKTAMSWGLNVRYHRHEQNIGMLRNWEYGIGLLTTDYFLVLADDDYLLPNCLRLAHEAFSQNPNLGMWCGVTVCLNDDFKPRVIAPSNIDDIDRRRNFDLLTNFLQHPGSTGTVFSTRALNEVGGFRVESHYLADLSMMLRVAAKREIQVSKIPVAIYSSSGTYGKGNLFNTWYPGCLDMFDQLERLGMAGDFSYKRYVSRTLYISLACLRRSENLSVDLKMFKKLFKHLSVLTIILVMFEAVRFRWMAVRNKLFRSELMEYCACHSIEEKIKKANCEL